MRKVLYFVLLPLVLVIVLVYSKGKGVKRLYWYIYWTTIIYFCIGVVRILWMHFLR